jgi:transposase
MAKKEQAISLAGMDAHSEKIELCLTRWSHGTDPQVRRSITTSLAALEATYAAQVPAGTLTVLEASTNAFSIARRLGRIGYEAKVLTADTVAGMSRGDRVNDRIDARNLAVAYARGGAREVLVPAERHEQWRDIWHGYRCAVKDSVKWSNRIWAFCSGHGFELPTRLRRRKAAQVRAQVTGLGWDDEQAFHVNLLLGEYEHACGVRDCYLRRIERIVAGNTEMIRVMQVLGIRFVIAFALVTYIEDARRFATARKLVSYIGLNPRVCESGKQKGHRATSSYGRRDLKTAMVEAAQTALRHGDGGMHRWARRKIAEGKHRNEVIVALARKMVCHVWHILMGHPPPEVEPSRTYVTKLTTLGYQLGSESIRAMGYHSAKEYALALCSEFYPATCNKGPRLQTVPLASA